MWGEQDGGEGSVGTVVQVGNDAGNGGDDKQQHSKAAAAAAAATATTPDKTVIVQWDSGDRTNYRAGHQDKFDLCVLDNASVGVRHTSDVLCSGCGRSAFFGIRWQCADCQSGVGGRGVNRVVDLCSRCYGADKHDVAHRFLRLDSSTAAATCAVPPRAESRRVAIRGIFPGAKVQRSFDWVWKDQDGGLGSIGEAVHLEGWNGETERSVVRVSWPRSAGCNLYRLGHKGKIDVQLAKGQPGVIGGFYYPDHLPVLGRTQVANHSPKHSREYTLRKYSLGDRVRISVAAEVLRTLQEGHGGFHAKMVELIGVEGRVHRVTDGGDIRVQYPGKPENEYRWTVHPAALVKASFIWGSLCQL